MTKEGKFKDAIQDRIGATVDTTDLDVTDTHYDKKISDLQRRLDAQYDRIDEKDFGVQGEEKCIESTLH